VYVDDRRVARHVEPRGVAGPLDDDAVGLPAVPVRVRGGVGIAGVVDAVTGRVVDGQVGERHFIEVSLDEEDRVWLFLHSGSRGAGNKRVWLSRKGAIDASAGRPGLIPGSMGTRSYVVTGKGNRLALNSAPHGAGRRYSRTKARKTFTRGQLDAAMRRIEWRRTDKFLDEIPDAYKPVEVIMDDARDLVEIRHTLRQIVNVKGD
jgi:RNA-splicing ligase RtcB